MDSLTDHEIRQFLERLGSRYPQPATIYLLGGSALCFLGNPRRTADIDYTTPFSARSSTELEVMINKLAQEMHIELESVPIETFIPLPEGSEQRHYWIGQFGNLAVYLFDPYSIALSKLSRGFETDLQDVVFLVKQHIIELNTLEAFVQAALPQAWDFDVNPSELKQYFSQVKRLLA